MPSLRGAQSASLRYRIAAGPVAGRKTLRRQASAAIGTAMQVTTPLTAIRDGFSLNAAAVCRAGERKKLERPCRDQGSGRSGSPRCGRSPMGNCRIQLLRSFAHIPPG